MLGGAIAAPSLHCGSYCSAHMTISSDNTNIFGQPRNMEVYIDAPNPSQGGCVSTPGNQPLVYDPRSTSHPSQPTHSSNVFFNINPMSRTTKSKNPLHCDPLLT